MTSLLVRGLVGFAVAIGLVAAAAGQAGVAATLHEAETTAEAELFAAVGTYRGQAGWGPWRTEVVEVRGDDGTSLVDVRIAALPDGVEVATHPDLLRSDDGGAITLRFADVPPTPGAWVPFAVTAAVLSLAALVVGAFAARPFGEAVFGQRAAGATGFGWLPGHGSHGGSGGQVPPYVPYSRNWDPRNRAGRR